MGQRQRQATGTACAAIFKQPWRVPCQAPASFPETPRLHLLLEGRPDGHRWVGDNRQRQGSSSQRRQPRRHSPGGQRLELSPWRPHAPAPDLRRDRQDPDEDVPETKDDGSQGDSLHHTAEAERQRLWICRGVQ